MVYGVCHSSHLSIHLPLETICRKCQNLFSGKTKKNIINLLSAELAKRVMKVNEKQHNVSVEK